MEYTRESLLEFKADTERRAVLAKTGGDGGGFGGFGGGGGGADKPAAEKKLTVKVRQGGKVMVISLFIVTRIFSLRVDVVDSVIHI